MSHPVYLLSGEEFLADEALDRVRAETGADPLSEVSFDARVPAHELMGALETPSLLGGKRLVVITEAHGLLKEQSEAIKSYLESPNDSSVLVLVASGRTKVDADVKKKGAVVTLQAPTGRRLIGWLRDRAKTKGLKIDDRAAWALTDSVGGELRDLDGALDQLSTKLGAGAKIGVQEVKSVFSRLADERIWAFTDAVGERKLAPAMGALRRLYLQGEDPLPLLGALANQIRRLLRARRHADRGANAVADALGLPTWRAERIAMQARAYSEDELIEALAHLARADIEIKGGDLPPEAALERAVVLIVEGKKVQTAGR